MAGHENLLTETTYLIARPAPRRGEGGPRQRDRFLIGRGRECDIVVPARQISRQHARISRTADGVQVEDLGSKNGTHVNGVRIEAPTALQDGDVVQVAFTLELVFVAHDATLPLEGPGFGRVGRLRMDARSHQVWLAEKEIPPPLSAPQYRLLEVLYRQPARGVPREEGISHVWPEAAGAGGSPHPGAGAARGGGGPPGEGRAPPPQPPP